MGKFSFENKVVILFLFALFLIPSVSSLAFQFNTVGDIKHPIRLNGGIPDASVLCNITILYPNSSIFFGFNEMTRASDGSYYNFTLNETQTSLGGEYPYDITCLSSEVNKTESFSFFINSGGIDPSQTKTDSVSRTIYIAFALGIIFFISFLFYRHENLTFKYSYFLLALLSWLVATNFVFLSLQDDVVNPNIQNFFSFFNAASFYLFMFFGFLLGTLWIFAIVNTIIFKNNEAKARRLDDDLF